MGLYDGIKDVAKIMQQTDNIELYQKLIELSSQALDMQELIVKLTDENKSLKELNKLEKNIIRHKDTYITLKDDPNGLVYCSCCWDEKRKLIQGQTDENGMYWCPSCKYHGYYDKEKNDRINYIPYDSNDYI